MKIMIVNSKTKQKPKTILERIRNLVLDFILEAILEGQWWQATLINTICWF